jgi:hypothetical protein
MDFQIFLVTVHGNRLKPSPYTLLQLALSLYCMGKAVKAPVYNREYKNDLCSRLHGGILDTPTLCSALICSTGSLRVVCSAVFAWLALSCHDITHVKNEMVGMGRTKYFSMTS